jgi:antitoxin component of RelBE/YafQ-DinJ toxin-antitoxin module
VLALNERFRSFEGQRQWGIGSLQIRTEGEGQNVEWHFLDGKNLNTIGNLALLGHRANSSFNNSLFSEKREILVQWQERELRNDNRDKGIDEGDNEVKRFKDSGFDKVEFVPTATIKAFFKQFSQEITLPFLWTEKDAENYVTAIRETLKSKFSLKNAHDSSEKGV